ncbi:MFS transporter, ACS family, glucarate transporter [Paraburkholderia steynii]|uniref:MFS transporter, ACS family, glucarate transporter n=1 Tax=Paraburkholderia steynii TaxID=1245441 RepID=A0A7Z7FNR1_9BURK|nr:MFS transporter [Paraburkholderia steynii]SDJ15591.1 MFS transporter, ACS family, glucarate transporter [Paraburkholderia steynii]
MSYRRGWIAAFLFSLSMINYMDRIALSIAATPIAREFKLTAVGMGYLFSSFIWSYALFLLPMGFLIDRYGTKRMAGVGIFIWSAATALTGAASSFGALLMARLVMGGGESVSNPVGAKVIRQWIPANERGMVTSMFNSGSYAGPAICSVILGSLIALYGWRISFVIAGGIGFVWLAAWLVFFNAPEKAKWLKAEEREKIVRERDTGPVVSASAGAESSGLLSLMRTPTLWGLAITQGCNVYTQYLFLTWLPSYLQASRGLSITHTGLFSAVPYAAAVILCIFVGRLSDRYLKKSGVGSGRRRNAVALAMLAGTAILAVPFISNLTVLLAVFSITLTGIASTTSLNFALLNDLLPNSRDVAKAMAFVVVGGNTFGLIAPIATGHVVAQTGSYDWAFGIAGLLLLAGATVVLTMTRSPMTARVTPPEAEPAV